MNTRPDLRKLGADEGGAIMVVGIFMCACLVGALWYVAGIGDALVLRERIQEASDAAAFSGAVLHARGMNLIVLINLVMACILGIRVTLKVVQLTLVVLGAIFTALAFLFPALGSLAGLCFDGAAEMQTVISELKNPIDQALKALSKAEQGMARVVPGAACAGGTAVAYKYRPVITKAFAGVSRDTITSGLPLQEGTADRLCFEAGKAFGSLVSWAIPINALKGGSAGSRFNDVVGKIVERGGAYFCEMGSGGSAPNLDDIFDSTAKEHCDGKRQEKQDKLTSTNSAWQTKCAEYKVQCFERDPLGHSDTSYMTGTESLKPEQKSELTAKQRDRDLAKEDLDAFDHGKCKEQQNKELKEQVKKNSSSSTTSSSGENMTPKMVIPNWQNGIKTTQIMGWAWGDTSYLRFGPKGVKVGAQKRSTPTMDPPHGADFGFSQAEYFYDCEGAWKGNDCNGNFERKDNEGAMWHFKWRARLRRYNRPYDNLSSLLEGPYVIPAHGALAYRAANGPVLAWTSPGNVALKAQLAKFANPADTLSVTIH